MNLLIKDSSEGNISSETNMSGSWLWINAIFSQLKLNVLLYHTVKSLQSYKCTPLI